MGRSRSGLANHRRAYRPTYCCKRPEIQAPVIPDIITTDLIIRLDANNSSSYNGSGGVWTNIGTGAPNYDGILSGPTLPTFVNGSPKYFNFTRNPVNSTTDYLLYNYISVVRPSTIGDDFSFCAWINTTQVGLGLQHYQLMYIVSTETGGPNNDFGFGLNVNGELTYGDGPFDTYISSTIPVNTGTWTFVAVTRDKASGQVYLYINGIVNNSGICNAGNTLGDSPDMLIGSEKDGPGYTWGGGIGLFLANTSVLSASQIYQNFAATRGTYGV